jgi:hypothetical protein
MDGDEVVDWREEVLGWFVDRCADRLAMYGGAPDVVYPDTIPDWVVVGTLELGKDYAAPAVEIYRWSDLEGWYRGARALMGENPELDFFDAMWAAEATVERDSAG